MSASIQTTLIFEVSDKEKGELPGDQACRIKDWETARIQYKKALSSDNSNSYLHFKYGAVLAMIELGVKVPEELKVVIHRTSEIDLICPFQATFLEFSVKSLAEAFLDQIHRQKREEPTPPLVIPIVSFKR